ncbi:MAG: ATP-dependent 6-phosphofructokinase [Micavibrio sp.]|nr:MAG: ATP-dependent 6-phosphofructokinase [Micavibrio sp.]
MTKKKRIGILTSGGDCAGLNAVLRAAVHAGTLAGYEIVGIEDGTAGLLDDPARYQVLTPKMMDTTIMRLGGTILGTTNKGNPFNFPMPDGSFKDRSQEIIDGIKALELEAVIGIGGDGSLAILRQLAQQGGINLIGIPKTIDNDLGMTEISVGFETAVWTATEALDRLQPTAASHDRVMILEVMGRDAGHIALHSGIAGGADIILIPEVPYDMDIIAKKIISIREEQGRNFALVCVSEAVKTQSGELIEVEHAGGEKRYGGIGHYFAERIAKMTGFETRVTVLGHVQRGCSPIPADRLIASAFGVRAIDLVKAGKYDRMLAWSDREVIDVPIEKAIESYQQVATDGMLMKTARALGICFGDV